MSAARLRKHSFFLLFAIPVTAIIVVAFAILILIRVRSTGEAFASTSTSTSIPPMSTAELDPPIFAFGSDTYATGAAPIHQPPSGVSFLPAENPRGMPPPAPADRVPSGMGGA
jgi:hypothetical protein